MFDYYFRTARATDANLQLSGGSGTMAYNVGVGYYDEQGVLRGTGFKRMKLQSNLYMKPFPKVESNLRFYLTYTDRSRSSRDMQWMTFSTGLTLETIPEELLAPPLLLAPLYTDIFMHKSIQRESFREKYIAEAEE